MYFCNVSGLRCRRQRVPGYRGQGGWQQRNVGGRGGRPRHDGLSGGSDRGLQPQLLADFGGGGGGGDCGLIGGRGGGGEADGRGPDEAARHGDDPAQHGAPQPGRTDRLSQNNRVLKSTLSANFNELGIGGFDDSQCRGARARFIGPMYRVTHLLADLG